MANPEHLEILKAGFAKWKAWRDENPGEEPDLREADLAGADLRESDLSEADLSEVNLEKADLRGANLSGANLWDADLTWAILHKANLVRADLSGASLHGAHLREADLSVADLYEADLEHADLRNANLRRASLHMADLRRADLRGANLRGAKLDEVTLVETKLQGADLRGCRVYGVSAWNVELEGAKQSDLVITREEEAIITVDNLEMAQFVYLLLQNEKIRDVIDTITSKAVLILGRFTEERKAVLDAVRDELRQRNFAPIVFDFDKPASKDVTGTVETLARMARFIIADLTDPSSIPFELGTVVPLLRTTPVLSLRLEGSSGFSMFEDLRAYPWVLPTYEYQNADSLLASLTDVIEPAERKVKELRGEADGES